MTKAQVNKAFRLIKGLLKEDPNAHGALDTIESCLNKINLSDTIDSVSVEGSHFSLPFEIKEKGQIAVFSDGACRGNPGPGAWGIMGQDAGGLILFEGSGVDTQSTNNKMELQGAIEAFKRVQEIYPDDYKDKNVFLYSDSKYVLDGLEKWIIGWKKKGWKKADGKAPNNMKQWKELDKLRETFKTVSLHWVKGHSGHPQNEYCDQLANKALDNAGF